jgi:hypothetical protein
MRLGIDPNVVPNWGIQEALREIIQGAIDECKDNYTVKYNPLTERLVIENPGTLFRQTLLIGNSDKRDDSNKIGQHGEGYKLSAAILLRNNRRFTIYNDNEVWRFSYKYDRQFKTEIINVDISKWFVQNTGTIKWEMYDITRDEFEIFNNNIINHCDLRGNNGDILFDRPGNIYSGGLFVCHKKELTFGYNFDVGILQLQRDRDLLSDIDIFWETSRCWSDLPDAATHLRNGINDVKYINKFTSYTNIADNTFDIFTSDHGVNANPCSDNDHQISGLNNVIVTPEYRNMIVSSKKYKKPIEIHVKTPYEILSKWYEIQNETCEKFEAILELSENHVKTPYEILSKWYEIQNETCEKFEAILELSENWVMRF